MHLTENPLFDSFLGHPFHDHPTLTFHLNGCCALSLFFPCKNKAVNSGTTYQQQRQYYITKKKDLTCPRKILWHKLIKQIKSWWDAGDRIILFMDHNGHVTNGLLGKDLGDKNGLDMR